MIGIGLTVMMFRTRYIGKRFTRIGADCRYLVVVLHVIEFSNSGVALVLVGVLVIR